MARDTIGCSGTERDSGRGFYEKERDWEEERDKERDKYRKTQRLIQRQMSWNEVEAGDKGRKTGTVLRLKLNGVYFHIWLNFICKVDRINGSCPRIGGSVCVCIAIFMFVCL